jgi:hypothetical protein
MLCRGARKNIAGHILHVCPNQLNSIPLAHFFTFPYKNQAFFSQYYWM